MPTLRFKIKEKDVEVTLTTAELIQLLGEVGVGQSTMVQEQMSMSTSSKATNISRKRRRREKGEPEALVFKEEPIDVPLPPDGEVKKYILSLPEYRHSLFDVQAHFFNQVFVSREATKHMYHKTFHQLQEIRKQIETEKQGTFQMIVGPHRVNTYVFQEHQKVLVTE